MSENVYTLVHTLAEANRRALPRAHHVPAKKTRC
jgi:hypothetical protein